MADHQIHNHMIISAQNPSGGQKGHPKEAIFRDLCNPHHGLGKKVSHDDIAADRQHNESEKKGRKNCEIVDNTVKSGIRFR
jgi:hypothetical protein